MSAQEPPRRPPGDTQPTEPLRTPVPPPPRTPRQGPAPVAQQQEVEREYAPYEPPPERPWYGSAGAVLAILVIALLLGGGVGYAIGNSNESSGTTTPPRTVTNTVTHNEVHTVTSKTVTQAPPNQANEEKRVEAETKARKLERENEELKKQAEAGA